MKKKYYITTPIYYVNDKPHIGHAYTTILADVLSRFKKKLGLETYFVTGLDEHGQKVEQAAKNNFISPLEHCDNMAPQFTSLWDKLHISNDDFIRTTEDRHKKIVQDVLQEVYDNGDIYLNEYEGLYSVAEERFITEKEAETGNFRDVKKLKEKNYFFKMSKFQENLISHIQNNELFIQPESRRNEILGFLKSPLNDLCISRPKSRLNWGIDLPFDSGYVTYVWFDALINYITAAGYKQDDKMFQELWPASVHLIGKDILTTHAIYWPTMLMSIGIQLPKSIFAHGWWLMKDAKMSKSRGNVVNPLDLIQAYGVDPVRFYLMREMVLGQDASFTLESFIKRYNSDLANDFGNLLSRISTLIIKNFNGSIPVCSITDQDGTNIKKDIKNLSIIVQNKIDSMRVNEAIEEVFQSVRAINKYMEHSAPWKVVKEDKGYAGSILYIALESLRICAVLLEPIMPKRIHKLFNIINEKSMSVNWGKIKPGTMLEPHQSLFPRIEKKMEKKKKEVLKNDFISFDDFNKIKLKTAKIIKVEKIDNTDRLLKIVLKVNEQFKQVVSGIAKYYVPSDLIGKTVILVENLKPTRIRGVKSEGMILAVKSKNNLSLLSLDDSSLESGLKVS